MDRIKRLQQEQKRIWEQEQNVCPVGRCVDYGIMYTNRCRRGFTHQNREECMRYRRYLSQIQEQGGAQR